ncbi:MAG: bifunctional oligoribonuclease/PAP phosphatase NrnA [Cytophagaceae bacterium]|jgi:phosphoesterase RecJ-like protein|nr:bifunctional oligoribonuclease/PAP phosphatase NrnA [Cytophagaceae bacterium]
MIAPENQTEQFKAMLSGAESIIIIPHKDPDGDATGASLAWLNALRQKGIDAQVVTPTSVPNNLTWMKGFEYVTDANFNLKKAGELISSADMILFLDFNTMSRLGELRQFFETSATPRVVIDHHPLPEDRIGNVLFSDITVSSACELCYNIMKAMDINIDADIAECLYTGIITDTGRLSYSSSRPEVYYIVGDLILKGIDKKKIHSAVYQNASASSLQLLGYSLCSAMERVDELPVAFIALSKNDLDRFNYQPGDTEDLVNYPLNIGGITFSALLSERKKGFVKASFRSQGEISVNHFARLYFSGGGHKNAAGGEMRDTLDNVKEFFRQKVKEFFELNNSSITND